MTSNPQVDEAGEQPVRRQLIESRSIDYVPQKERHGKVWHQGAVLVHRQLRADRRW